MQQTVLVFGATGSQGGSVVTALVEQGRFQVRAVSRNTSSEKAQQLAAQGVELVEADLNNPQSLSAAMQGVYGVFLVTNFWDPSTGNSEYNQVQSAVEAAKAAGVEHFVWSTLPDVASISAEQFKVVHFSNKARANQLVSEAGFKHHSFVEPPFFFQNFLGDMQPQPLGEGISGWAVPMDPSKPCIHAGDISELGLLVKEVFAQPDKSGDGQTYAMAPEALSWQQICDTLNEQGYQLTVNQVPGEVYDQFFPGAAEIREMFNYFEAYSYFGPEAQQKIAAAKALVPEEFTPFSQWTKQHMPIAE